MSHLLNCAKILYQMLHAEIPKTLRNPGACLSNPAGTTKSIPLDLWIGPTVSVWSISTQHPAPIPNPMGKKKTDLYESFFLLADKHAHGLRSRLGHHQALEGAG